MALDRSGKKKPRTAAPPQAPRPVPPCLRLGGPACRGFAGTRARPVDRARPEPGGVALPLLLAARAGHSPVGAGRLAAERRREPDRPGGLAGRQRRAPGPSGAFLAAGLRHGAGLSCRSVASDATARLLPVLAGVLLVGLPWFLRHRAGARRRPGRRGPAGPLAVLSVLLSHSGRRDRHRCRRRRACWSAALRYRDSGNAAPGSTRGRSAWRRWSWATAPAGRPWRSLPARSGCSFAAGQPSGPVAPVVCRPRRCGVPRSLLAALLVLVSTGLLTNLGGLRIRPAGAASRLAGRACSVPGPRAPGRTISARCWATRR